jgi:hypothetical protein
MLMQVVHVLTTDIKELLYKGMNWVELDEDERQWVTGTNVGTALQMDLLPVAITIVWEG